MSALLKVIGKCQIAGAVLSALALALMFALGLAEIVMRSAFDASIPVSLEYSGYLVAFSFLSGAGWTLDKGKHVRVTLLSPKGRSAKVLEILVTAAALVLSLALAYGVAMWALGSFERAEVSYFPSATPLWIPQAIFALGPLFLTLSLLGRVIRLARGEDLS